MARTTAVVAVIVLVLVAVAVYVGLPGWVPGGGSTSPQDSAAAPTLPGLDIPTPPAALPVLTGPTAAPRAAPHRLRVLVAGPLAAAGLGHSVGFAVQQLGTATRVLEGAPVVTPASTMKLLTTTAALATLGPAHTFTTSVVQGSSPRSIVLVGGGDPLLVDKTPDRRQAAALYPQPASLQALADQTAARLTALGIGRVRLGYDAGLFDGPAVNPRWPSTYLPENVVSPISALWVNEGRAKPGLAQRTADPARAAATAFRAELTAAGVRVVGATEPRASAPPVPVGKEKVLASVESAPLAAIVQHTLEDSDNEAAEVLLRQVALAAGGPGSSVAGVTAVRAALTRLGLDLTGATFYDGSGLSRQDAVPVRLLLDVLVTAADPSHPNLRSVVTGLPVAGFDGTLGDRFAAARYAPERGYIRAKTGTLTGVQALAGFATTRTGQQLAFVAVADRVPPVDTLRARAALERIAVALARCGC